MNTLDRAIIPWGDSGVNYLRHLRGGIAAQCGAWIAAVARFGSRQRRAAENPKAAPGPDELRQQAARCRQILEKSLIAFYLPGCVDEANGGYYEGLRDGKFAPIGEKFLTLQARQLWFFSVLAAEGYEP
jgi:hypothetical protein